MRVFGPGPGLGRESRAGLALCALAALVTALAPVAGDLLRGPAREGAGEVTTAVGADVSAFGAILAALLIAAALARRLWAHLAGVALGTVVVYAGAFQVASARDSERFAAGLEPALLGGATTLLAAGALALVGVVVTLAGIRLGPRPEPPEAVRTMGEGPRPTSVKAVLALVLAVAGALFGILPPLAIALGTLALLDIRERGGAIGGNGLAVTGVAIGILVWSVWLAGLATAAFTVTPG